MRSWKWLFIAILVAALLAPAFAKTADEDDSDIISAPKVDVNLKGAKVPLKTDDEVVSREEQAMTTEGYTIAEQKLMREQAEKHTFQTEVNKLMHILINSLYSNKEIFLRELISNSSDALDKIRFLALTNPKLLGEGDTANLDIRIKLDKTNKTIQITDRGVGMTKEELVKNLGTIAQSGTKEFLQKFSEQGEGKSTSNLIGQFGVGFYSAFLVADTVSVTSKSNEGDQYVWSSDAAGSFTVVKDPQGNTLGRGTRITLHLKEDAAEFLEEDTIKTIAKKYSEFINFPIYLWTSHTEEKEVPVEEDEVADKKDETIPAEEKKAVEVEDEEDETEEEEKPKTKKITETKWDWELLNQTKPIWTRSPKDITEEEYHNFYKSIAKQTENPLKWIHFTAEGDAEFKSILFIPTTPPSNMFDPTQNTKGHLKLFVRRVFITDDFEGLIPNYLKFIHGIVDSDDLPLNVSREILQQNKLLKLIEKKIVRKSIAMFQELASQEDKESYKQFWSNYGTNIKLGVIEDAGYQTTGNAPGNLGFVNITDLQGGKVGFGSAAPGSKLDSSYTKSVKQIPYNVSVLEINSPIIAPGILTAPAPTADVNITALLEKAGCKTFASLLVSSGVIKTYESAISKGLTVFAPDDEAFKAAGVPDLSKLSNAEVVALLQYHAANGYNPVGALKTTKDSISTLATNGAGKYDLTVTTAGDSVTLHTGVDSSRLADTVLDSTPLAIFTVDNVLLPSELFGKAPSPAPAGEPVAAPSPAPVVASPGPAPVTVEAPSPLAASPPAPPTGTPGGAPAGAPGSAENSTADNAAIPMNAPAFFAGFVTVCSVLLS